ncbi:MAG TPA: 23S rRNA (uracil(1939)-C(5))-methyltransferase RlmD [Flavobacteriales bacterium]|jgi:23S rRNA (uracil1939-C5)-methyltransferase|nr:23S rRNA (uracil(1939)-C(5))-methyltransferase RlmD [Flavobacteriales bacterium]MBK7484231.1 23S rRNA (uracil(1939)-C(5))-methyltransferase RlmD [Flavobacteriales bacterium]MBK8709166.1 23S rRNA (uracil(1939)-C(5))-methyltransferase RlmD [Flavobacteriales bacterium]MBP8878323.1 23S rRNA (uracil(1939)-C(5))-methyltransferase RlmD [Flavobacteriales bacterium]MBP9177986.1 23S rRNA (uracil(1939)-C(5))-methyltransferase RlmD [Flavobacteriales bacterium]
MRRAQKFKEPILWENLSITGAGAQGKAIAKHDGLVVFVTGAVPGDVVDVRVTKKKSNFAEAITTRIVSPSPDRIPAFCKHFGTCGGCKWQDLSYPKQLEYKQQQVIDNLERIGGLELPEVTPIMASSELQYYRNKLEFSFCNSRWFTKDEMSATPEAGTEVDRNALGFHIPMRFDRVLDISECFLQPAPSDAIRNHIREHARQHGLSFYDPRAHVGFLRTLLIRTTTTGECMVLLALGHEDVEARERILEGLMERFPELTSVLWTINTKKNDTIYDLDIHLFHGRDHIVEDLPDGPNGRPLKFRIGPKTFFQTNPAQTIAMYRLTRDLAGLTGGENVYDLYCGAGSITLYLAAKAKHVTGVELVPESVADARINAEFNNITNVSFAAGDMKKVLDPAFVQLHGAPDVVVTDPPRAGMDEPVVRHLLELAPPRIVYVSCNPATQARDLAILNDRYRIDFVQPIDMFPHTYHVENVVRLVRR